MPHYRKKTSNSYNNNILGNITGHFSNILGVIFENKQNIGVQFDM